MKPGPESAPRARRLQPDRADVLLPLPARGPSQPRNVVERRGRAYSVHAAIDPFRYAAAVELEAAAQDLIQPWSEARAHGSPLPRP